MNKADGIEDYLLYSYQVKKAYLEACITTGNDPDIKFLQILQQSESQPSIYQSLDLTSTQDLANILKMLENEKHINQIQIKDVQLQKHRNQFEEFQSRNPKIALKIKSSKIEFKEDTKSKQPIPALDLNQISASINSKASTKSNRQYSTHQKNQSCKNLKNLQQFFTDRISGHLSTSKDTERKISSISPNTKIINLNLAAKTTLNQVLNPVPQNMSKKSFYSSKKKEPYFIDFLGRQEFQTSRNYLKKMNSTVFNKTQSITSDTDRKQQVKKTPASSFISIQSDQLKKQSSMHKERSSINKEQSTSTIKQECQSMHIPVKFLLESNPPLIKMDTDRFKSHLSNRSNLQDFKKDRLDTSRENSFKKQLNLIVQNSDKNGIFTQKQQSDHSEEISLNLNNISNKNGISTLKQSPSSDQSEDISIHLKNLINFCNQSIQKKEKSKVQDSLEMQKQFLISQKENVCIQKKQSNNSKIVGNVEIKTLNLKGNEDNAENPETARFNQDESEYKKLNEMINFKKNGHQTDRQEAYFQIDQLTELKKIVVYFKQLIIFQQVLQQRDVEITRIKIKVRFSYKCNFRIGKKQFL